MPLDAIEYKGHLINILQDEDPRNPFTDDDGNPAILSEVQGYGDRYNINLYSNSPLFGQRDFYNWQTVFNSIIYFYGFDLAKFANFLDKALIIADKKLFLKEYAKLQKEGQDSNDACVNAMQEVSEGMGFEFFSRAAVAYLLEAYDIKYFCYDSKGDSQGDFRRVLIVADDNFFKVTGCKKEQAESIFKSSKEMFDAWLWGRVAGFFIPSIEESCWGFYGDNYEESGLLPQARIEIERHISFLIKQKAKRLKQLLKNRVPLHIRADILK